MNIQLTVDEIFAIQGIILGLQGLTGKICRDYRVDNMELYKKLADVTDRWVRETYPT